MNKKQKADKVVDLGYKKEKRSFTYGFDASDPFAINFVYLLDGSLHIVKGHSFLCDDYVKKNYPLCVYNSTIWEDGRPRFSSFSIQVPNKKPFCTYSLEKKRHNNRIKWVLSRWVYGRLDRTEFVLYTFKRLPKKWGEILKSLGNKTSLVDTKGMSIYT